MTIILHSTDVLDEPAVRFYRHAMTLFREAGVPFLVGGAYAFGYYTGIVRHTKDFDLFVRAADADVALQALRNGGYRTELTFPHWLGKAFHGDDFVDVIFSSGNGYCTVDDDWFRRAVQGEVLGVPSPLIPAEEMIWQKAFIQERERFDGADVAHVLRARGADLDWDHLLRRFGPTWRVLYSHLVLFGFIYPDEKGVIPAGVMLDLTDRIRRESETAGRTQPDDRVCQGTLLSRVQYLTDTDHWGYADARLARGVMTPSDVAHWTAAAMKG